MGINYNDSKIPQDSGSIYYNSVNTVKVHYNGNVVWQKCTPLEFTFSGNSVTGYKGSATSFTIPDHYYTITDIDGTVIFTSTEVGDKISVTAIADDAFANNTTVTSVTIPSSIKTIGARAFQMCVNLTTVSMSATPTSIGYCAFAVTAIQSLSSYMYNCTSIGQGAFATRWGWHLKSPSNVTTLDGDAVLNRLLATNMGSNLSSNGYTGAGSVYVVRSRFNVHQSSGGNSASGGTFDFDCHCNYNVDTDYARGVGTLSAALSVGGSSTGYTYAICSLTIPDMLFYGSMTSTPSNYSSYSSGCSNETPVAGGTLDHDCYCAVVATTPCLINGTKILLANNRYKNVEDITYKDLLKVWNFETGTYDYQYPLTIIHGDTKQHKTRIILEDNTYLDICGHHDIYDPVEHKFRIYGEGYINKLPDYPLYVMQYVDEKIYNSMKVIDIQEIVETVQANSILTGGTITAFANNIMIGFGTLNFARIKNSNSFEKEFQIDKTLCYTYDKFRKEMYDKSRKYLILGLNLHYVDYYNRIAEGLPRILAIFDNMLQPETKNNKYVCTIGLLDGNTLIETNNLEDEEIILPEIKAPNKTQWYIVGEYKYLKPGDTYKINFSTLIRSV